MPVFGFCPYVTKQANLGFAELQAMRQASPTGGALGQVAVQELDMLQSTLASLNQSQSPEQLRSSLNEVKQHYQNWKSAVEGNAPQAQGVGGNKIGRFQITVE